MPDVIGNMTYDRVHVHFHLIFSRYLSGISEVQFQNEDLWERAGLESVAKYCRGSGAESHTLKKPASSSTRQALTWNPREAGRQLEVRH